MPAESAHVRPVAPADLRTIATIFAHYVTTSLVTFEEKPPEIEDWRRWCGQLSTLGLPFLVAQAGEEVVGYAYASRWRPKPAYRHTVESSLYLAPGWTGKGMGGLLLDALLAECAVAGVSQVIAVVADTGDDASIALHRSRGFTEAGRLRRVGHKRGRWIDTVLLQRDLTAGGADE